MKRMVIVMILLFAGVFSLQAKQSANMWKLSDFSISVRDTSESNPVTAYNFLEDEFIVVWQDRRLGNADIFGRILHGDGTPRTPVFPIFTEGSSKLHPHVAYNRIDNEYMVVWTDWRREEDGAPDIYGIRLDVDGRKIWSPRSVADTSFVISDEDSPKFGPKVSHNYIDNCYLAVWFDERGEKESIWGQRLASNADLLPPEEDPDTKINFPITPGTHYSDMKPVIAYHGGLADTLNEWLVAFMRSGEDYKFRIWACRVNGANGVLMNTWGMYAGSNPAISKSSSANGGPPWFPEFPVSWEDTSKVWPEQPFIDGSPHVWSNDYWTETGSETSISGDNKYVYPVPEFMVSWSSNRAAPNDWNIMVQRIAYFQGNDALEMGLIEGFQDPFAWVSVPLNVNGKPDPNGFWMNWHNYAATNNPEYQSWNNLDYNQNTGEFLVVWNDWREEGYGTWPPGHADIYGQHLYIDPLDSSLVWTDHLGNRGHDPAENTPIAATSMDEGNTAYPALAYSIVSDQFLVTYQYADPSERTIRGIHGTMHAGAPYTSVHEESVLPRDVLIARNYPNPFNPETVISFSLPQSGKTSVVIVDLLGREILRVFNGMLASGLNEVRWNGKDSRGRPVGSGVYFYRIESRGNVLTGKMILIR